MNFMECIILMLFFSTSNFTQGKLQCAPNWVLYDETNCCYKFVEGSMSSYFAAREACMMEGAHVVSIHSQEENDFVLKGMENITNIPFWIGGRLNQNRTLEWDDHTRVDFYNWKPGEPNNWGLHVEDSVMMESTGPDKKGKWIDVRVITYNLRPNGYVCKKCADSRFCPTNWLEYGQTCYLVLGKKHNAAEAEQACSSKGGALLSITSEYEQKFIVSLGEAIFNNPRKGHFRDIIWTSGKSVIRGDRDPMTWKWGDGSDVNFQDWGDSSDVNVRKWFLFSNVRKREIIKPFSNFQLERMCIGLAKVMDFHWQAFRCDAKGETICKKSKDYSNYNLIRKELINQLTSKSEKIGEAPYGLGGRLVEVNLASFLFTGISEINDEKPSITLGVMLEVNWYHPYLKWNVTYGKFKGIENIYMHYWGVWTPDINFLFMNALSLKRKTEDVYIQYDGLCRETLKANGEIQCSYSSFNFPFDSIRCTIGFGPPAGWESFFRIIVPEVIVIQTKLRTVIEGYAHQGWIVSRINATMHKKMESITPTMDLSLQAGYLMVEINLDRNFPFTIVCLVIPIACSMLLVLLTFWVSDLEVVSFLVMTSLLVPLLFLQDTISRMPHFVDSEPIFLFLYGVTLVSAVAVFTMLQIFERVRKIYYIQFNQNEATSDIFTSLYAICQKVPGNELNTAERNSGMKMAKPTRKDVTIFIVKKLLFTTLFLIDFVMLTWLFKLIYSGYYWSGPLPNMPFYNFSLFPVIDT